MAQLKERITALMEKLAPKPGPPIRYLMLGSTPDDFVGTVYLLARSGGPKAFLASWTHERPEGAAVEEARYPDDFGPNDFEVRGADEDFEKDEINAD